MSESFYLILYWKMFINLISILSKEIPINLFSHQGIKCAISLALLWQCLSMGRQKVVPLFILPLSMVVINHVTEEHMYYLFITILYCTVLHVTYFTNICAYLCYEKKLIKCADGRIRPHFTSFCSGQ